MTYGITVEQANDAMLSLMGADLSSPRAAMARARKDYIRGRIEVEQLEAELDRLLPLIEDA